MRFKSGFTLIELMVSISVLAIIIMLSAPSFNGLVEQRKLDHVTRELTFVLTDARAKATTSRKKITIKFEQGENNSSTLFWLPKYETIKLDSTANDVDFSDVVISSIGQVEQREKLIPNPDYKAPPEGSSDPLINPPQIKQLLPLKFTLCNTELNKSKTIELSINGTVSNITNGDCS